ncbi:haloacid dehalogenase-like hydrolase domain-containing protein Sgpp isoform X2 [Tanacetum coccineum]
MRELIGVNIRKSHGMLDTKKLNRKNHAIDDKINIAGKHDVDIAAVLFPDDVPRSLKFCEDKEEYFRKFGVFRFATVTNATRPNAELMISTLGLTDFFHLVIIGGKCEHPKPAPDPYLKALEVLNVSKEHAFICEEAKRFFRFVAPADAGSKISHGWSSSSVRQLTVVFAEENRKKPTDIRTSEYNTGKFLDNQYVSSKACKSCVIIYMYVYRPYTKVSAIGAWENSKRAAIDTDLKQIEVTFDDDADIIGITATVARSTGEYAGTHNFIIIFRNE